MGPLSGIKVVEFTGLGPGPFATMMLADMGADVVRIDRRPMKEGENLYPILGTKFDILGRNRRSIALDLKNPEARDLALRLVSEADVLIEGFRPGVMERLGLGPDQCMEVNPRLIFCRVTGWGQTGHLKAVAGHDLNYLALSGALASMGRPDSPPCPPLNLIGDFGGGGMLAAFGVTCALLETGKSGRGQIIDAAMLDGTNALSAMLYSFHALGEWSLERGQNRIDGASPFYDTYECADGKFVAIAAIEPHFYKTALEGAGIDNPKLLDVDDRRYWPEIKAELARHFKKRTRDEWCETLENLDGCISPVLDIQEAPVHPQNKERSNFVVFDDVLQPAPAPRFSRTPGTIRSSAPKPGEHTAEILKEWNFTPEEIQLLTGSGAI